MRYLILAALAAFATCTPSVPVSAGPLSGTVLDEGATAELVDLIRLPDSSPSAPFARIGHVREAPDDSGRLFANDLNGFLYRIEGGAATIWLDLASLRPLLRTNSLQWGFVSFAFHPDFSSNGLLYTAHTESLSSSTPNFGPPIAAPAVAHAVLTEWQATDPAADTFAGSSRELMRVAAPHSYHNLGELGFDPGLPPTDPDYGLLYVATGDFGSVIRGDPGQLQRLDSIFGCILRIDPLGSPFTRDGLEYPYGIPATNPFASDPDPEVLGEIFAWGLRNPQNFHFDRGGTGTLFLTDIGQANLEEVNIAVSGANYGWPEREGNRALDVLADPDFVFPLPAGDDSLGYSYPAIQIDHAEALAIAGGLAVRSPVPSKLQDSFVFGDIVTGRLFYSHLDDVFAAEDGDPATTADVYELQLLRNGQPTTLLQEIRSALGDNEIWRTDLRFSSDAAGRLFVSTKQDGWIRELVPVPDPLTTAPPGATRVAQVSNQPNPFNPRTEILFTVAQDSGVRVEVYSLAGRKLRVLLDEEVKAGPRRVSWDGRDSTGKEVVSGVYLYRIQAGSTVRTGKMSLVR